MWKRSPTWPASLQGPNGTLPLAADTGIFVSPSALISESLRWGKIKGRTIQGRYKCKQPKNETKIWLGKFFGGKMLLLRSLWNTREIVV